MIFLFIVGLLDLILLADLHTRNRSFRHFTELRRDEKTFSGHVNDDLSPLKGAKYPRKRLKAFLLHWKKKQLSNSTHRSLRPHKGE